MAMKIKDERIWPLNLQLVQQFTERNMMLKTVLREELERIDTLPIVETVAYANRLIRRLERNNCTDGERKNGLMLLEYLTERVRFLKIISEPAFN